MPLAEIHTARDPTEQSGSLHLPYVKVAGNSSRPVCTRCNLTDSHPLPVYDIFLRRKAGSDGKVVNGILVVYLVVFAQVQVYRTRKGLNPTTFRICRRERPEATNQQGVSVVRRRVVVG